MGQINFKVDEKRTVTCGWDRPMRTWFAQLWDEDFDPSMKDGEENTWRAPAKAVGYHDAEKVAPLAGEYGPYPVESWEALVAYMIEEWQIAPPQNVVAMLMESR